MRDGLTDHCGLTDALKSNHLKDKTADIQLWMDFLGLGSIGECQLNPGDVLALYTDGVTEAHKDSGEEFGENALIDALHQHGSGSCQTALEGITSAVRDFNPTHQHDDITLIIAKCRADV